MSPKVTVLMALYNGREYLKCSLNSILHQTRQDFEFLIIDDGCTDNSLEIIGSFRDDRIKIHHNPVNIGQTRSLNVGLKLAKGEYIARMDADDLAFPHWLEKQVHFLECNPGYSVVSANAVVINEKNKIKKIYKPPHVQQEVILRSLVASPINHVGSLFRKDDILKNGGYDETYKTAADYDLWGKLLRNNQKITTTDEILVAIREHAQSLSRSERGKREIVEIMEIAGKNIEAFTNTGLSHEELRVFCMANYASENLTEPEFRKALSLTQRIYGGLRPFLKIENRQAKQWLTKRCETIYLKRIFAVILEKDYSQARRLSCQGIRLFGLKAVFFMIAMGAFFGGTFLCRLPGFYEKLLRKIACIQLNRKFKNGVIELINV